MRRFFWRRYLRALRHWRELAGHVASCRAALWPPRKAQVTYVLDYLYDVLPLAYVGALAMFIESHYKTGIVLITSGLAFGAFRWAAEQVGL